MQSVWKLINDVMQFDGEKPRALLFKKNRYTCSREKLLNMSLTFTILLDTKTIPHEIALMLSDRDYIL